MVTEMYVRGLSTRDVEGMFAQVMGQQMLSRSGISRITATLQKDFDSWRQRDLSGLKVLYLFLDAIYLALRQGTGEKEGVLCAYGILEGMAGKCCCILPWAAVSLTMPGSASSTIW